MVTSSVDRVFASLVEEENGVSPIFVHIFGCLASFTTKLSFFQKNTDTAYLINTCKG